VSREGPRIRRATPADLDAVVALEAEAGAVSWSRAQFAEELARNDGATEGRRATGAVLLAEAPEPRHDQGGLLGCAVGWIVAGEVHVLEIAVAPAARRRGVGRALLSALIDACGGGVALLEVRASNTAARTLYEGSGFVVVGRRPKYYPDGEDALLMTREPLS